MRHLLFALVFLAPAIGRADCEVVVTGKVSTTGKDKGGPNTMTSDYWYTPEELDKEIERVVRSQYTADIEARIAKRKANPYPFRLACLTEGVIVDFHPAPGSRNADMPFAAKRYDIKYITHAKAGDVVADVVTIRKSDTIATGVYDVRTQHTIDSGVFEVTRFDAEGFAGRFALTAGEITVKGSFDFPCHLPTKMCRTKPKKK